MIETEARQLFGRTPIFTDEAVITRENVVDVLTKALLVHSKNQGEIEYLWSYYRGQTPILSKTKEVRESINHRVCVNRANEIVTFKKGYGFGEPIQYIRRGKDDSLSDEISALNEYMFLAGKQSVDLDIAEWLYIGGFGIRMVLPGDAEDPLRIYSLDPRYSFVVKYRGLGEPVVMGVKTIVRDNGLQCHSVYTKDTYFEVENGVVVKEQKHVLGDVPMFVVPSGKAMLGVFEPVLPLLDAINEVESNRLDDIEQYVNSFLALLGGTIDDETAAKLDEYKMLCLPEGVDAKYLSVALQQNDIQVLVDNLYDAVLAITGVPYLNGDGSTSDNGVAVALRNGWQTAESQMKSVELEWKESEKRFLKMALRILNDLTGLTLPLKNIDIKFSRRNYDNIQTKSQVLATLLATNKVHPEIAFASCGLFLDPESAYLQSKEWWEELEQKEAEAQLQTTNTEE